MTTNGLQAIDGGRAPGGWEQLWASDRWPLRELPHADLQSTGRDGAMLFDRIAQPWLKEAAKRWARSRLLAGGAPSTMSHYVHHVAAFSGWLADRVPEVVSPAGITRTVLEDWLLSIRSSGLSPGTKTSRVSAVRLFLEEQWEDGLARMPRSATIHAGEIPSADQQLPRGIEALVFDQLIDPANLALLPSEQHRTIILLLAFTGLRISSIVTLARDALEIGTDGHPYLRYLNVKLRREAVIPIGPVLHEQLHRQEELLIVTLGVDGTRFLLPSPPAGRRGASRGEHHVTIRGVRHMLKRYVLIAEIRDSHGQLASWLHPHRFRHHLGTSLLNEGVPLSVIQRVLDHGSIRMTARYAHLDDETVKREMHSFHDRVNVRGQRIALPVDGPLGEAAWMKERIARAKQALPNGYCGLPLVRSSRIRTRA
jgi:site-specific recombinase XerD